MNLEVIIVSTIGQYHKTSIACFLSCVEARRKKESKVMKVKGGPLRHWKGMGKGEAGENGKKE
jgi:hypothetical protein